MKSGVVFSMLIILFTLNAAGQKVNNVWAFGNKAGIDFNTSPASRFISKSEGAEPPYFITSICDADGALKFYTDGLKVWNRDNFLMPKYRNWWPWSDTVMPLICPYPGKDSLYYLFGICNGLNANKLLYLTINLKKAGDLEEVVYPRPVNQTSYYTTLSGNASLLLAGTAHCNQKDYWIVAHTPGVMKAFLVSGTGVNATAVESAIPANILPAEELEGGNSNIKFSANGERLVVPYIKAGKVVVLDFDNLSGQFSNAISLSLPPGEQVEDVELSPDGNRLYVGSWIPTEIDPGIQGPDVHSIYQMNLEAGSPSQVEQSLYRINGFGDKVSCIRTCFLMKRTMQLGPDGKIYVSMRYTNGIPNLDLTMSVIEDPNKYGENCRYREEYFKMGFVYKFINYNYIRSGSFSLRENGIKISKTTCADKPVNFALLFNRVDSVRWDFGDPTSGAANFSSSLTPQHQYPAPGTYTARAIIYIRCMADTATKEVVINPEVTVRVPAFIKDTFACTGNQLVLDVATSNATEYKWENGLIYSRRELDSPGHLSIAVYNACSMDKKEFNFVYKDCPCDVFIPNAFTPNNDGKNDVFRPVSKCFAQEYTLRIYDRYGGIVYKTNQPGKGWDGTSGSHSLPSGVYIWTLEYRNPNTKVKFSKNGTVVLIR